MKFGCCIGLDPRRLEILNKYGYTCYETGFAGTASSPDEKILAMRDKASELGMTCVSHNGMFPGDYKLLGGKDEYAKISEFLDMAFAKVKPLASPVVVLGSGAARKIPDDMSLEEAKERFIALLSDVIAPMARKYNVTIAIEELRREECNFINNCREAMEIIRAVRQAGDCAAYRLLPLNARWRQADRAFLLRQHDQARTYRQPEKRAQIPEYRRYRRLPQLLRRAQDRRLRRRDLARGQRWR